MSLTINPPLRPLVSPTGLAATSAPEIVSAGSSRTRLLLEGPLLMTILRLAAPNIVVMVVQAASSTFDALFVGRLGAEALAGVSLVFPAWMFMVTMSAGAVGNGVASAIARALGAGRRADAEALVNHALLLALGAGLTFSAALLSGGPALFQMMGGSGSSLAIALAYSNVVFAGALAVWLVNILSSILRGSGEMLVPAVVIAGGELLHIALAPALIFGLGPFPALGVTGAAVSLVASYLLRAGVLAGYLLSGRAPLALRPGSALHRALFWDILRVGIPGTINTVAVNLNVMVATGLVGTFGTFALAGYGVGARLEYLQIPLTFGFGSALVTLVGTNVGAGQFARARRAAFTGALLAAAVTGSIGLVAALAPSAWVGAFSAQPEVLAVGAAYLRTVGPTYGLFGFGLALYFAAQGAGQVFWPVVAGCVRLLVTAAGGWIAINWLGGGLPALFVTIALGFVVLGGGQTLAINAALRRR